MNKQDIKKLDAEWIERIWKACIVERKFFADLLKRFVLQETPSDDFRSNRKFLEQLETLFDDQGCETELIDSENSGGQLKAELSGPSFTDRQLILGHADTVWPVGTLKELPWKQDGNIITGPGVYDMKAGLVMMISALRILRRLDLTPELQPVFFINSDEETGSRDSRVLVEELAKTAGRCFVPEPGLDSDGKLKTRRKGSGLFRVIAKGVAAHAGIEPEKGISAIHELSHVIRKLYELNNPAGSVTVNVGKISGGTAVNVVAAKAVAVVNVRVLSMEDMKGVEEQIKSIEPTLEGTSLTIEGGFNRPPMEKNERNDTLWKLAKMICDTMGSELNEGTTGGGSDGSFASLHTATLDGLGAVGEGAHSLNEKIFLEETLQRFALFTTLLMAPNLNA
jgi:glutamate carboxypeptidase